MHCVAGVSRSASICLAYLTKFYCRSLRDAYHVMCSKRPMVRPNLGFWRQLIHYEQLVKGNAGSVRIVRDDCQPDKLLPDVYLKNVIPERTPSPGIVSLIFVLEVVETKRFLDSLREKRLSS